MSPPDNPYLEHRELIEGAIRFVSRRYHLPAADAQDFASTARLHLVEHDAAVLRAFRGRSSLRTYLLTVVSRVFLRIAKLLAGLRIELERAGITANLTADVLEQRGFDWIEGGDPAEIDESVVSHTGAPGDLPEVQIAVARLAQRARADRSATTLSALGAAYLAAGQIQRSVEALEEAVALSDRLAFAWSDLSAAYLARSTLPGNAADVPRALDAAERALALQPDLHEGVFNRALALQRLGLVQPALDAWRHYLAVDADSPWAEEARGRLADLEQRQARAGDDDLQALRERLFDEVLPAWTPPVSGEVRGSPDSPDMITGIAGQLSRRSSDRFAADIVAAATHPVQAVRAASGHVAYGGARAHYKRDAMDAAAPAFDEAAAHLTAAGSPLALSARLYRALVAYRTEDLGSTEQRLKGKPFSDWFDRELLGVGNWAFRSRRRFSHAQAGVQIAVRLSGSRETLATWGSGPSRSASGSSSPSLDA